MQWIEPWVHLGRAMGALAIDSVRFLRATLHSRMALAAENLFLRKQLALYRERQARPRRASDPLRLTLVLLARVFAWREALTIVQPATLPWGGSVRPSGSSGAGDHGRAGLAAHRSSSA